MMRTPIRSADLLQLQQLLEARLSPAGDAAVYVVAGVDEQRSHDVTRLRRVDLRTRTSTDLTDGTSFDTGVAFSPSGDALAFCSARDGQTQLHVLPSAGGESTAVTALPHGVASVRPAWSPRADLIAFAARARPPRDMTQPYRVTRPIWQWDGLGLIDDVANELFVVSPEGDDVRQLTARDAVIREIAWSPDGAELLYTCFAEADSVTVSVRAIDVATGRERTLVEHDNPLVPPVAAWLPDGRVVHTVQRAFPGPIGLVVRDRGDGEPERRTGDLADQQLFGVLQCDIASDIQAPRLLVEPDGRSVLVCVQRGGRTSVCRAALEGPLALEPAIELEEASCFPLDVDETAILFASSSLHVAPDLYIAGSDGADSRRLTDLNGERYGEPRFHVHELSFEGTDGTTVEGWYLEPSHRAAPHPTLLHIHGGPFAGQGHIFSFEHHLAADAGYGMLLVNYRGSSGYGARFAAQIVGHYGEHDHTDLVRAVDHVVELGLADPDALGCYGSSNGGFETVWMVTHTDRFKAAVAEALADRYFALAADIYGLMPTLAGSPVGVGVEAMGGYVTKSLITRAGDCTTPLLIIVNERDRRCPTQGSDALYNVLKLHGAEVEMLRMPEASHDGASSKLGSPRTRVAQNEALIEWMSDHLNTSG